MVSSDLSRAYKFCFVIKVRVSSCRMSAAQLWKRCTTARRRAAVRQRPPPRQFGPGTEYGCVRVNLLVIALIGRDLTSNFDGFQMTVQTP